MAIWRPPFAGALSWVAGVQWPEGNEDAMWAMAQDLEAAATQAREAIQDVIALSNATEVVYPSGRGGDAMRTWLEQFQGEDGSLEKLALSYEELADSADKFGTELQATKLNYHAGLMWFVAEMAVAALMGPGGLAYQSTVIAMARTFFQRVARAALQRMAALAGKQLSKAAAQRVGIIAGALLYETVQESLEEVFQGTAQEYGIQRFQVSQGHLDQVDGAKVWQNAKISAVAGAAGGLTGGILNSAATKPVGKWAAAGQGAAIGATAGTAGGAAAYVATGLDTNNWEFDPRSITSGAISGTGPGAINGYQNAGDGSSSRTAPAPTTTSPAPGPDTRTSDAPGGSKAAPASTTEPATRESDAPQTSTPPSPTTTNNSPAVSSATTNTTTNTPSTTNNNAPAPTRAPTVGTTSTTSNSTSSAAQSSSTNSTTSAPTTTAAQSATSATNSPDTTPLSAASTGTTAAAIDTATTSATNADVEATTSQPAEPASTVPVPDTTDPADVSPAVVEADAAVAQPDSVPPVDIQPADSTSPAPVTPVTEPATPHAPDTNGPLTNLSSTTALSTAIPAAISTPGPTRASETRPPTTPRPEPGATSTPDTEAVAIEHASVSENDTTTDVSEAATHRAADIDNPEPVGGRGLDTAVVQARATASTEAPATRVPVETEQRGADPTNTVPDTARTDPAARATAANEPSSRPRTTEAPDVAAGPTTENTARTDSPTYDARLPSGEGVRHRPTGTAVGEDPHTHRATQNLSNDGAHDVVVHGRADGLPMPGKRVPVHPQEIVDAIRANPHYRPGTPVRLVSCHAANGWAQYVADQLGVVVTAPTDRVGVPREPNSAPVIDNGGRWHTFRPQRADETPSNSEEFTQQPTRDHADAATTQPESGRTDWMSDGPPRAPAATQLRPPPGMTELPEPGVDARLLGSLDLSDPSVTTDDGDPPAITHIDGEHVDDFSRRLSAERGAAYVRAAEVDPAVTAAYEAAKATAARLAAEQAAAGVGVRTAKDALRAAETTLRDATEQQRPAAEENVRAAQSSMRSAIESAKQAKQALNAFESTDQSATAKTEYEQAKKATLPAARRGNVTAITIDRLTGRVYEAANGPSTYTIHPDMLHRALYDNVALRQDPGEVHTNPDHTAFPHADHPLGHAEIRTTNAAVHDRELLNSTPEHAGRYPTDHDGLASILNSPFVPRIAEEAPCCANCTRVLIGTESTAGHIIDEGAPRVEHISHADVARTADSEHPLRPRLVSTDYPDTHPATDHGTDWMSDDDSQQPDPQTVSAPEADSLVPEHRSLHDAIEMVLQDHSDIARVIHDLVNDPHPLNLTDALRDASRRTETLALLREIADSNLLDGRTLTEFVTRNPRRGALFEPLAPDVNSLPDGWSRMAALVADTKPLDPARTVSARPDPAEQALVDDYAERLKFTVEPAVKAELARLIEGLHGATTNVRTKPSDAIIDKVRRMVDGAENRPPRPNYQVGDAIDAVGARITVDNTEQLAELLTRIQQQLGTGDNSRIVEIENMYATPKPRNPEYRVIPMVIRIDVDGLPYTYELQLTTRRASIAADINHNTIYKPYIPLTPSEREAVNRLFAEAAALEQIENRSSATEPNATEIPPESRPGSPAVDDADPAEQISTPDTPSKPETHASYDLRQNLVETAQANTPALVPDLHSTRTIGPDRLADLEDDAYLEAVQDALLDGEHFIVGADPRTNDYGQLINDGGPTTDGRAYNCVDNSLAALSSFYGRPAVALPRTTEYLPDGELDTRGELDGLARAENWIGGAWQDFTGQGMTVPEQFAALHDWMTLMGPGSAAFVHNQWHAHDANGWPEFDEGGYPIGGTEHTTVIVFPYDADSPVWWDPQSNQTSDKPPTTMTDHSVGLAFMSIDSNGGTVRVESTAGNPGTGSTVSGPSPRVGAGIPDYRVPKLLGVPESADTGGVEQGSQRGQGLLRGEQGDRGGDLALERSATVPDRPELRPGSGERRNDRSVPDVPTAMAHDVHTDPPEPQRDRVHGAGAFADGSTGRGLAANPDNRQTVTALSNKSPNHPPQQQFRERLDPDAAPQGRDLAGAGHARALSDASEGDTDGSAARRSADESDPGATARDDRGSAPSRRVDGDTDPAVSQGDSRLPRRGLGAPERVDLDPTLASFPDRGEGAHTAARDHSADDIAAQTDWMSDDDSHPQPDRQAPTAPDDSGDLTGPPAPDHATPHVPTNAVVRERLRTLSRQITAAATEQHSARRQLSTLAQELGIDPGRSGPRTLADEIRSASQARIDTAAQVYEQRPSTPDDMVRHIYRRHAAERTIDALAALNNRAERQLDRYLQARTTESELRAEAGRRAVADILTAARADVRSEGFGVVPGRPPHALAVSTTDPHSLLDDSRRRELQDAGIGVEYHRVVIDDAGNVHVFDLGSSQSHTTPPRIPGPETTLGDHYRAGDRALETARQRAVEQLEDAYRRVVGETRPESPLRRDPAVSQRIDQARAEALERLRQTHQAMATELDTATREALGRLGEPSSTPAPDPAPSQAPVPAARTGTRARLRRIVTGVRERIAEWNQAVATAKHPSGSGLDGKGQNELFHTPFRVSAQTEHRNPGEKEAFADVQAPNIARILHEAAVLYKNRELLWRNYVGWTEASSDTPPTRRSDGTPYRYWNEGAVENADDQEFVRLEAERTAAIWRQVTRPAGTDPDSRAELDQVAVEQNPELARRLQRAAAPATDAALFAETNPVDPTQLTPEARAAYADALRHATLLRRQAEALDLTLTDLGPAGLRQAAAELHARNVRLAGAIDAAVDTWQRFRGEDARLPFTRDVDITRNNSGSRLLREIAGEQASFVDRSVANPANMGSGPEFSTPQDEAVWQAEAARRTSLRNEAAAWAAYLDVDDVAALDDVRTQEQVLRDRLAADIRQSADFVRRSEQYLRVQARLDALTDVDRAPVAPIDPPARLDPAELALPNDIDLAVVELAGRLGIDRAALDPARIRETLEALRRDNIIRAGRVEALAALAHHQVAWAAAVAANKSESEHNQPMPVVEPGRLFPVPNRIDSDAFLRAIAGGHDIATALNSARTTIDPNADWLRFALVYDTDLKSHEVDVVAAVVRADIAVLTNRLAQLETGATTPDSARTADRLRAEIARRHDWLDTLRATTSKPDADRITRTHQEIRAEIVRRAAEIEALADLTTRAGPSPHRADPAVGPNAAPTGHPLAETARQLVDRFSATATTIVEHFEQLAHTLDAQAETTLSNDAAWESTGPARSHVATTPEVAAELADLANRVEHAATQRDSAADALRARARDLGLDPDIRGPRQAWQAITDHLGPRRAAARQVLDRGAGTVSEHLDARAVIDAAQRHQQAADQLMFDYLRARDQVEDLRTQLLARAAADVLEAAGALDHHAGVGTVPAPTAQVLAVTGDSDPHRRTLSANDHRRLLAANVAVTFQRVLVGERGEVHVVELRLRGGNDPTAGPIGDPRVPPPGPVNLAGPATEQGHPDPTTRPDSTERQANPSTPENITRGLLPDFNRVDYEFSVNPVQAHEDPALLQQMEALLTTPSGGFETHFDPRTHPAARHVNGEGPDGPGRLNNCGWAAMAGMSTFFGDPRVAPRMLPVLGPNGTAVYQGGLDREYISRWLGTGWLQFDPAMSIEDQYRALHDLVAELGPGTAVYVATRWQRLDQDGNRVFRPDGSARLTGGHATLVVYPRDADTPVWWDTQELTATDHPPAKMLREAGTLQVGIVRADGSIFDPTDAAALAAEHRIAATQSWTSLPSTDPVLRTMHATLSDEQLRGATPTPSEQPPDLTTAPDLGTESPAIATPGFDITHTVDSDGNPVTSLTLRIHLQQTGDITPGEMGRVRASTQLALTEIFGASAITEPSHALEPAAPHTPLQLPTGARLQVRVEFVDQPGAAHLRTPVSRIAGLIPHGWAPDATPTELAEQIRDHFGLQPHNNTHDQGLSLDGMELYELRDEISHRITAANTRSPLPAIADARVLGFHPPVALEQQHYQEDLRAAALEGDHYVSGFDPRRHPVADLVNDGGTTRGGRESNCWETSVAAITTFFGDPHVARAALAVPGRNGVPEYRAIGDDSAIRQWLGADSIDFSHTGSDITEHFDRLHDLIAEIGPGSAAFVGITWQGDGQEPGGRHMMVIVHPTDGSGPIWWDPQSRQTWDRAPAQVVRKTAVLTAIPLLPDGSPYRVATDTHRSPSQGIHHPEPPTGPSPRAASFPAGLGSDPDRTGPHPATGTPGVRAELRDRLHLHIPELGTGSRDRELSADAAGGRATAGRPDLSLPYPNTPAPERGQTGPGVVPDVPGITDRTGTDRARVPADRLQEQPSVSPDDLPRRPRGSHDPAPVRDRGELATAPNSRLLTDDHPVGATESPDKPFTLNLTPDRPSTAEAHARYGTETVAGVAHHADDSDLNDLAQRVRRDDNYFTADVHLSDDGEAIIGGHRYTAEEYGDLLRQHTSWDGRKPIRLIGCDAATVSFAARVAAHLGTDVLAPTARAWTDGHGRVYTSGVEIDSNGNRRPRIPPDGQWITHHPDGTTSQSGLDGFAPGTSAIDRSSLDPNSARDRGWRDRFRTGSRGERAAGTETPSTESPRPTATAPAEHSATHPDPPTSTPRPITEPTHTTQPAATTEQPAVDAPVSPSDSAIPTAVDPPQPQFIAPDLSAMPPLRDFINGTSDAELMDILSAMNGRYGPFDVRIDKAEYDDVEQHVERAAQFKVVATVHDPESGKVGVIKYFIYLNKKSQIVLFHQLIDLVEAAQGRKFSAHYFAAMNEYYSRSRVNVIEILAGRDGGGYAWARRNFKFDMSPDKIRRSVQNILARIRAEYPHCSPAEQSILDDLATRFAGDADNLPNPREIADIPGDDGTLGKRLLRGSEWWGRMEVKYAS
ncbi:toxin glutamine deamidase domain-containing protein [Nocardia sp. NPDC058518]|uniref:toxin glutamine deamidase domain-containing protein n=1 Tax=Nocardia sp. NPDC058518 TaxID=3346534 RepID=UPI00364BFAD6